MASCDPMNQTISCLKNGYIHVPTRSSTVDLNKYLTILTVPTKNSPWFTEPAGHRKGSRETRPHRLAATATSTVYNHPLGLRQWLDQLESFHSSPGSQPASSFPTPRQIWVVTLPFCIDGSLESRPCLVVRRRVGWSTIWSEGCSKGYDIINQQ